MTDDAFLKCKCTINARQTNFFLSTNYKNGPCYVFTFLFNKLQNQFKDLLVNLFKFMLKKTFNYKIVRIFLSSLFTDSN